MRQCADGRFSLTRVEMHPNSPSPNLRFRFFRGSLRILSYEQHGDRHMPTIRHTQGEILGTLDHDMSSSASEEPISTAAMLRLWTIYLLA
jgi:hypothetical protein